MGRPSRSTASAVYGMLLPDPGGFFTR